MTRRRGAVLLTPVMLIALASLALVACGGGKDQAPTAVPLTTCKPGEGIVPDTPASPPPGFSQYLSPERGYSVLYPSDWQARPNTVGVKNITGDSFFSPTPSGEITPNVSVTCETVPVGTTSQQFADNKRAIIERLVGTAPDVKETLTVDGKEAFSIEHAIEAVKTPTSLRMQKVEVFFADDMGGWTISLTAPEGTVDTYRPAFDALVRSYHR